MEVSDDELREMVREALAARQGAGAFGEDQPGLPPPSGPAADPARLHLVQQLLPVPAGSELDGACLIEPTVRCNHCGYCQSYGH